MGPQGNTVNNILNASMEVLSQCVIIDTSVT